jgi:hypothetical protein
MNALVFILYALLMGIGMLPMALTYRQWKKYRRPFYSPFLYYILFSFIFGFLNYFGRFIAKNILVEQGLSEFTRNVMDLLLNGLALPFCLIGLYFFIIFIRELLEQIGIGGGLTAAALPHHRTYGSVSGGSYRLHRLVPRSRRG